jgi:hypothetical protein
MPRVPESLCREPSPERIRMLALRRDRIRAFAEGHRYDPATHHLLASVAPAPDRPREAITIVPGRARSGPSGDDGASSRERFPTMLVPVECDAWTLLDLD